MLFQHMEILKDDAEKVLHSICQHIWKTQQWPQAFPVRIQPEVVWARGNMAHGYRQPPDPECEVQAASSVPLPQGHVLGNPHIS